MQTLRKSFLLAACLVAALAINWPTTRALAADEATATKTETKTDSDSKSAKKKNTVSLATLTFKDDFREGAGQPGLFGELQPTLKDVIDRLDKIRKDDKVAGVVLHLRNAEIGRGKLNELRTAIARLRKGGKKVYADLQIATPGDYLLATACDEIIMPESGMLIIPGMRAELTFLKGTLDKLGIQADFVQVGDYKGAAESFTRTSMSPQFREQFEKVIDDYYDQMVSTIAEDRKLDKSKVKELLDEGLFMANRAKEAGLVDRIAYEDQFRAELAKKLEVDEVVLIRDYGKKSMETDFSGLAGFMKFMELMTGGNQAPKVSKGKKIAIVYAVGPIMGGESTTDIWGNETLGCDTIVKALRDAEKDDKTLGIVLRVDSPGGSGTASDMIWREIVQMEKPVVASMGNIAASGGYYISMGCDKIVAEPGTLTGSIGVISGKLAMKGLYDKIGMTTEAISRGKNSGMFSATVPFSPSEREMMQRLCTDFYDQFTSKAAKGRKMDVGKLRELAQGKLYSGEMAAAVGLVDAVGTVDDAVAETKKLAGLKAEEEVELYMLPKPKNFFEQMFGGASIETAAAASLKAIPEPLIHGLRDVEFLRKIFADPAVTILPFEVDIK